MKQGRLCINVLAAGATALAFCSCDALDTVGSASKKAVAPIGAVGEKTAGGLKKINPVRLLKKDDDPQPGEVAGQPGAGNPTGELQPVPEIDTRNTVTPGAQPNPNGAVAARESITLPSQPQPLTPPVSIPPPTTPTTPTTPTIAGEGGTDLKPVLPPVESPAPPEEGGLEVPSLTDPPVAPTPEDDGFLKLSPKLPEEESILPPE